MKKIFTIFSWTIISILFLTVLTVVYWSIRPYKILEFKEGNGQTKQTEIKAGEYIELRQHNCKYLPLESKVNRQFIDSIIYQVPTTVNRRPVGCTDKTELIYIPKALSPGEYYIYTTITYKVNPIREIIYTVKTNPFMVLK